MEDCRCKTCHPFNYLVGPPYTTPAFSLPEANAHKACAAHKITMEEESFVSSSCSTMPVNLLSCPSCHPQKRQDLLATATIYTNNIHRWMSIHMESFHHNIKDFQP
jgi:hypothetical protein